MNAQPTNIYESALYQEQNSEWHAVDGPGKALDIWQGVEDAIDRAGGTTVSILEVGCGTGAILAALRTLAHDRRPDIDLKIVGLDIAEYAIGKGRQLFPHMDLRVGNFLDWHEPVDAILFCDVLEHLENPFEFLRLAGRVAPVIVVRQPLQGDYGMFRKDLYRDAIARRGHIQYFSARGFRAIAEVTGWRPSATTLVAPWEMKTHSGRRPNRIKAALTGRNREAMSFLTSGFYLNGSFVRA